MEKEYPSRRSANDPLTYEEFAAQSDKRDFTRRLFRILRRLAFNQNILQHMSQMHWFTVDVPEGAYPLLLSDDPLLRTNGLRAPDGHMATPLSPTRLLIGTNTAKYADAIWRMRRKDIAARMNLAAVAAARELVAAPDLRQSAFVEKHFSIKLRPPLAHDTEFDG